MCMYHILIDSSQTAIWESYMQNTDGTTGDNQNGANSEGHVDGDINSGENS